MLAVGKCSTLKMLPPAISIAASTPVKTRTLKAAECDRARLNAFVAIMKAVAISAMLPVIRQILAPGQCINLKVKPVVSRNVVAKPLKNRILFIVSCLWK